jgi:hypothetical protein
MAQSRLALGGSVGLTEIYDDNLFSSPDAQEPDHIWRFSPRVTFARRSPRLVLSGAYTLDAETFRRHPSLDTPLAGQDATVEMTWSPSSRLTASAHVAYATAQGPGRLVTLAGLEFGRLRGSRLAATESVSWQVGALTKSTIEHNATREEVEGFPATDMQAVTLRMERQFGPRDRGLVSYGVRQIAFGPEVTGSHAATLGWSRQVTPQARFEFEAGPRLSEGALGAEVSVGLKGLFQRGEAGLAYVQTQTTVLGAQGAVTVEGLTGTFGRQLGRSLRVAGGPAVFRMRSGTS